MTARNRSFTPQVRSLQAVVNQDWLSPAVMRLDTDDILHIGFDELSHNYHRFVYRLERCEVDWSSAEEMFESDWLEGFNDGIIDDYELSVNTITPYTHYRLEIPNSLCRLKMSGNYRLHIINEDSDEKVATFEFMVTEQTMGLTLTATTNTDIDSNDSHQQLAIALNYGKLPVTRPDEQIKMVVTQNGREDNSRHDIKPSFTNNSGLEWSHCRWLIFDAGNEYRKYEVLDPSHPTMGIDYIRWDGSQYQVFPFIDEPRSNYIYDEDADGAFYIRNSDNRENDTSSEYVWVNYRLKTPALPDGHIVIDGMWTTESPENYTMQYDAEKGIYTASIFQKQGYYSYQYLWQKADGRKIYLPSEGSFFQTENRYQAYIYYKGIGERTWRLTAYRGILLGSSGAYDRTWR
jgi:hypothetical protein